VKEQTKRKKGTNTQIKEQTNERTNEQTKKERRKILKAFPSLAKRSHQINYITNVTLIRSHF
jgi:hypothetical protein